MTDKPILYVTHEPLESRLAGPAIRAWHLAHQIASSRPVILATPSLSDRSSATVTLIAYDRISGTPLGELAARSAAVIVSGYLLRRYPVLAQVPVPLVVDVYDPFVLENLAFHATKPIADQVSIHESNLQVLVEQLRLADFLICASETQRDFWLGMLAALGRVNPHTLAYDPTLRRLIDVVPFGIPDSRPVASGRAIKGRLPGITQDDRVIYWGGGIWDWFDPLTLIRAVAQIAGSHSDVRLVFAGVRHPSPDVPPMRMCQAAIDLSESLGLTGQVVFFNDWVPYDQRGVFLLEADIGVSLHFAHVETRLSFRTRLLDYLWAGLPMVVTQGDAISELVAQYDLGRVVAPEDVDGVRQALLALLDQPSFRQDARPRFQSIQTGFHWSRVSAPLCNFCERPWLSADRPRRAEPPAPPPLWSRAWRVWRQRGLRALVHETRSYLAWRLDRDRG